MPKSDEETVPCNYYADTIVKTNTARLISGAQETETLWAWVDVLWVSICQPVLHPDEVVRCDRGPVPTEIIYFLCGKGSVHPSECIVVLVHVRLPLLNNATV